MNLLSCIIFSLGVTSLFAQSLFLRELIVAFYGNEISVGILLSSWLVFTGFGSMISYRVFKKTSPGGYSLSLLLGVFSASVFIQFLLIQLIRPFFGHFPGEIFSLLEIVWCGLIILAPSSVVNGMLFSLSVRLYSSLNEAPAAPKVYGLDALGDMAGGILFAFWAAVSFTPWQNAYGITGALLLLSVAALWVGEKKRLPRTVAIILAGACLVYVFIGLDLGRWEKASDLMKWRGFEVKEQRSSLYGNLVLTQNHETFSVYENGILSFSFPDPVSAEEIVHVVFAQNSRPRRVLVMGGGLGGVLSEILKYPVEEVVYLELNPAVIELVKGYLTPVGRQVLSSPRLTVINLDVRDFLHRYRGEKFDVVLMDAPMPYSISSNRFYTRECFSSIRSVLTKSGVFSFAIDSQQGYISSTLRMFAASMFHTLEDVFPKGILIPGKSLRFIAAEENASLSENPQVLEQRFNRYDISTQYFSADSFASIFLPWEIQYVYRVLEKASGVRINHDFSPVGYYYSFRYFVSHFRSKLNSLFLSLAEAPLWWYYLIFLGGLFIFSLRRKKSLLSLGVFIMGAAGMAATVVSVIVFQMIYGYVYYRIGFLGAGFMLGGACGVYVVRRYRLKAVPLVLAGILLAMGVYCLVLPRIFYVLSVLRSSFLADFFTVFPFVSGLGVGMFFSLACEGRCAHSDDASLRAGFLYGVDTLGGACGGIMTSLVFLPIYGVEKLLVLLGMVLISTALGSYVCLRR